LILVILTAQLLPPLPQLLGLVTSHMAGTVMAAMFIMLVCLMNDLLPFSVLPRTLLEFDARPALTIALIAGLLLLHAIIADRFLSLGDLARALESFVPLAAMLAGGAMLGAALSRCPDGAVDSTMRVSFWVLLVIALVPLSGVESNPIHPKPAFPFTETSHWALAFGPVLLYRAVRADERRKTAWVLASVLIGMALQSLSLLAGCVLIAVACRRLYLLMLAIPAAVLLLLNAPLLGLSYYTSRLDFSGTGLSNLVYLQGWQLMQENWHLTSGWGIGFQQLGMHETQVAAEAMIRTVTGGLDENLTDGSFVLSKIVSEFGWFGVLLALAFVVLAVRCMKGLRARTESSGAGLTFARCVVVAYSVDMFIRGTGFFTQSTLMFLAALAVLRASRCTALAFPRPALQHAQAI